MSLHKHDWVSYHDQDNAIYLFAIYYRFGEGCAYTAGILFRVETAVKMVTLPVLLALVSGIKFTLRKYNYNNNYIFKLTVYVA